MCNCVSSMTHECIDVRSCRTRSGALFPYVHVGTITAVMERRRKGKDAETRRSSCFNKLSCMTRKTKTEDVFFFVSLFLNAGVSLFVLASLHVWRWMSGKNENTTECSSLSPSFS
jgi:hypothetical protein